MSAGSIGKVRYNNQEKITNQWLNCQERGAIRIQLPLVRGSDILKWYKGL